MVKLLDQELEKLAKKLVQEDKVIYTSDAEKDIIKWDYSKKLLKRLFSSGILISGRVLYSNKKEYHDRNYCISCYRKLTLHNILGKHYVNIAWKFTDDFKEVILFIHTSPCGGYEINLYKELKS